jgi:hypothetical protein
MTIVEPLTRDTLKKLFFVSVPFGYSRIPPSLPRAGQTRWGSYLYQRPARREEFGTRLKREGGEASMAGDV